MEVTAGLGSLRFSEMEEGKGRGFDSTFRPSTLAMVVIFLLAAFPVLVDFYFVLVCLRIDVIAVYHTHNWFCLLFWCVCFRSLIITVVNSLFGLVVYLSNLDLDDLLVMLDLCYAGYLVISVI